MPLSEETPLLVDPPIDDESFRQEARSFPSDEQKHLTFSSYCITNTISRFSELSATYLVAASYSSNLIAVTLYSFIILSLNASSERFIISMARMIKSRIFLLNMAIALQRLSIIAFAVLLPLRSYVSNGLLNMAILAALAICIVSLKASLYLYQRSYRADWLKILANSQENVRLGFEKSMHGFSVMTLLLLPIFTGFLGTSVSNFEYCRIIIFLASLGFLIETSLIYKLYGTCFALYLDRNVLSLENFESVSRSVDLSPMIGVLTTPTASTVRICRYSSTSTRPLSKIYKYVRRKPVPVAVTFGAILINTSLLTLGPHMLWFLMSMGMSPLIAGVIKVIQTLVTLHPALSAQKSFVLTGLSVLLGAVSLCALLSTTWISQLWLYVFSVAIVLSRTGVPTINLIAEQFVEDYLADEEVHRVYKENAVWLRTQCELIVHILFILWPWKEQFIWPIATSAILTFCGMAIMLRVITKHFATNSQ